MRVIAWPAFGTRRDNPYNALLYTELARLGLDVAEFSIGRLLRGRWDVWHIHWPDFVLQRRPLAHAAVKAAILLALVAWVRRRGTRVVWTVHNLQSHERRYPALERLFWRWFTRQVDGFFALSAAGRTAAEARFPALRDRPAFVVPHGHYRGAYPDAVTRAEARDRLGLPRTARVLVFVGQIREYKNVPALLDAFRHLEDPDAVLVVAGRAAEATLGAQIEQAATDPRIYARLGFVPDDDLQLYLRAADVVALPYQEILNSGSALLALSFDRPVLVPDKGSLAELRDELGPRWVRTYEPPLTPAVLAAALAGGDPGERAPLDAFGWPAIARRTHAAYAALLGRTA